VDVAKTKLLST